MNENRTEEHTVCGTVGEDNTEKYRIWHPLWVTVGVGQNAFSPHYLMVVIFHRILLTLDFFNYGYALSITFVPVAFRIGVGWWGWHVIRNRRKWMVAAGLVSVTVWTGRAVGEYNDEE
ncbi:MAG: hypothetical protein HUU55_07535 [Myxococcales bacterium]|nr:hypothetical protein [Myxococcales bacterium]